MGPTGATGPAGATGATGATGPAGTNGVSGWEKIIGVEISISASTFGFTTVTCSTNKKIIGGGCYLTPDANLILDASYPNSDNRWLCQAYNQSVGVTAKLRAYAICATVN
jgi:hypothetical protein